MNFQRVILAVDMMLGWRMHVELDEPEVGSSEACGAIYYHFNRGTQVFEFDLFYLRDIELGLLSGKSHGVIWRGTSEQR